MANVLAALSQPRREVRVGTVVSVAGGVAVVDVAGGQVDAQLTAQTATATSGMTVFLLPVADTWLVIAFPAP